MFVSDKGFNNLGLQLKMKIFVKYSFNKIKQKSPGIFFFFFFVMNYSKVEKTKELVKRGKKKSLLLMNKLCYFRLS